MYSSNLNILWPMITHNYCYNFSFFTDFFAANPGIKKYDVLSEMGMKDYNTLKRWFDGVTMMPLHQLMKFCNLYSVPITAFFLDENATADALVPAVPVGTSIEPVDGWKALKAGAGVKIGPSHTEVHYCSNLPVYCKSDADIAAMITSSPITQNPTSITQNPTPITQNPKPITPPSSPLAHEERMRYLDIIEKLSNQVAQLSQSLASSEKKQIINRHEHYTMVGEGDIEAQDNDTKSETE